MARTKSSRGIAPFTLRSGSSPLPILGAIGFGVNALMKKQKRKEKKAAKAAAEQAEMATGDGVVGAVGGDAMASNVAGGKEDTATMIEEIHDELVGGDEEVV